MGFNRIMDDIKRKRDYETEIAELKEKLKAAEAKNTKLQNKIDVLENSANAITNSDAALKQSYELQKIIENFKKELAKLPPMGGKLQERYNTLFVIIDYFCIPVLKELGMQELSDQMKAMSVKIKEASITELCAVTMHSRLNNGEISNVSEFIKDKSKKFIGCDAEKQKIISMLEKDFVTVECLKTFMDFVNDKYNGLLPIDVIRKIGSKGHGYGFSYQSDEKYDRELAIQWLEMVITIGSMAGDFLLAAMRSDDRIYGHLSQDIKETREFDPDNPFKHTYAARNVYKLLYGISEQFGLDFSKMDVLVDRYPVCKPNDSHYIPKQMLEKSRD